MIRLVLFDIDGTLIRTAGAGVKAFARTCEMEFKVPNGTEGLSFAGRTDPSIVREFFKRYGIEPKPENFQRFFDSYVFWLDHLLEQTSGAVLPGVADWITELQSQPNGPVLGLLTGNIRLGAQIKLSHYGIWHHFATGGFGDDHEDRDQIAAVARARGCRLCNEPLRGEQILVIGDTPLDVKCGKAIGAKTLAVATGTFAAEQLSGCGATWVAKDLRQVSPARLCRNSELS
jgi:phosphoglycolate phosphatase